MSLTKFHELYFKISDIDTNELYHNIYKNIKKYRQEKYRKFKKENIYSTFNPYSGEHFSELIGYSYTYYRRLENTINSTRGIPLDKLFKIAIALDKKIDDFFLPT